MSGTGHAEPVDPQPVALSLGWFLDLDAPAYYDVQLVIHADLLSWMVDAAIQRTDPYGAGSYTLAFGKRRVQVKVQYMG